MRELGIRSKVRIKRFSEGNKRVKSAGYIYENLLNRDFSTTKLNQKWVTDTSEMNIGINGKKLHVSVIIDLFNNEIVGYSISPNLTVDLVEKSLLYASRNKVKSETILLHSDRGMTYRSNRWNELIEDYGFTPSMSRHATCLDNACMEGFFSQMKEERPELRQMKNYNEAKQIIEEYMAYYNVNRIQGVLGYKTPYQARRAGERKRNPKKIKRCA
jgi:transposase InsO family protein